MIDLELQMLSDRLVDGVGARDAQYRQEWSELQEVDKLKKELAEARRKFAALPARFAHEL